MNIKTEIFPIIMVLILISLAELKAQKLEGELKKWEPHLKDWKAGDSTWKNGKGKEIIGAQYYLTSNGMNSASFLTNNMMGDDQSVFP